MIYFIYCKRPSKGQTYKAYTYHMYTERHNSRMHQLHVHRHRGRTRTKGGKRGHDTEDIKCWVISHNTVLLYKVMDKHQIQREKTDDPVP